MVMMFEDPIKTGNAVIKVIGVGGAGCNAVNTMIEEGLEGVDFIVANTDKQQLEKTLSDTPIQIGESRTQGLGAGSDPNVGREAAQESQSIIAEHLKGANMVFVTAGMGGGTGTGAAPVIAKIAKDLGALTVAVVTKPFKFEGKRRRRLAEEGLDVLRGCVDTLITIPNERLLQTANGNVQLIDAFKYANSVLLNAVRSISDLITQTGFVNTDFADVRTVMLNKGTALMGTGVGTGENRMIDAAQQAISSPLLDDISLHGATNVLLNITSPRNVTLMELSEAASLIEDELGEDGHVIWGHVFRQDDLDEVKITIIATGFNPGEGDYLDANAGQMGLPFKGSYSGSGQFSAGSGQFSNSGQYGSASGQFSNSGQYNNYSSGGFAPVQSQPAQQPGVVYGDPSRDASFSSQNIAEKMRELDAKSESLYAASSPSGRSSGGYEPVKARSYTPGTFSAAGTTSRSNNEAVRDASSSKPAVSETNSAVKDVLADDLEQPAYLRRSSNSIKNSFLDDET